MSERTDAVFNALAVELKDIEDQITAIKNKQPIGTDSIELYTNLTTAGAAGGFDIDYTSSALKNYSVVFTADHQKAPFCDLVLEGYLDGLPIKPSTVLLTNTSPAFFNAIVDDSFLAYTNNNVKPGTGVGMGWYFAIVPHEAHHFQVRVKVIGTDTGKVQLFVI